MDIDDEDDGSSYSNDMDRNIRNTVSYVFNTNEMSTFFKYRLYEFASKVEIWADSLSFVNDYSLVARFLDNDGELTKHNELAQHKAKINYRYNLLDDDDYKDFIKCVFSYADIALEFSFTQSSHIPKYKEFVNFFCYIADYIPNFCGFSSELEIFFNGECIRNKNNWYDNSEYIHYMYKSIYGTSDELVTKLHYNGGVSLSPLSVKRIDDFAIGDYLYADRNGNLVGEEEDGNGNKNYRIGICIITNKETRKKGARFVALNFNSTKMPDKGNNSYVYIYFGSKSLDIDVRGDMKRKFVNGGEAATEQLYDIVNQTNKDRNWEHGMLTQSYEDGFWPVPIATWRYHTKGTKRGDWYIPSMSELGAIQKLADSIRNDQHECKLFRSSNINLWSCCTSERQHTKQLIMDLSNPNFITLDTRDQLRQSVSILKVTE